MCAYEVEYVIRSDMDNDILGAGRVSVVADSQPAAEQEAVSKVHDEDPRCDERIHPMVQIISIQRVC